jgi:hypothetical protein
MTNEFEQFIYNRVAPAKEHEVKEILSIFYREAFEKKAFFKERDTVIRKLGFLIDGSARSYFINDKGDEITNEIVQRNNFLSDIISVRTAAESPIVIEFIEKSTVLVANMNNVWALLERNVTFNILIREYIGDRAMELLQRHLMFLNGNAKERYRYVVEANPEILTKFPLKYIATMIGVTQTQLSRIRKEID